MDEHEQEIVGSNIGNEVNSHPVDVDGNLIRVSPIMCGAVMAEHPAHARETGEAHPVKGMMRRRINVSTRKPVSGDRDEPGQRSVKVARLEDIGKVSLGGILFVGVHEVNDTPADEQ